MKSIDEIVQRGGRLNIYFHDCQTKEEALKKLSPFKDLGDIKEAANKGYKWLCISTDEVDVSAFYEEEVM